LRELVASYNLLVSEIIYFREKLLRNLSETKLKYKRIVQENIPHIIEKLQCLFIESASMTLIAIIEVKKNHGSKSTVLGKLKNTKYMYSKKPLRLK
jgi:hypothetical protein